MSATTETAEAWAARQLEVVRDRLDGWRENPPGCLVPSEPDPEQRAMVRIRLRAMMYVLRCAVGPGAPNDVWHEREDHRDLQRIRDAARADFEGEARS